MMPKVPHSSVVVTFCLLAIAGYALLSTWVVTVSHDAAIIGDVVGTWKSFAVAAFAFWIGSSSGGKARDAASQAAETPTPTDPNAGA